MRAGPSDVTLAGAVGWTPTGTSSLGDHVLGDSIPIIGGSVKADASLQVAQSAQFTVPEWADGMSWVPDAPDHPLAKFGQAVDLGLHVPEPLTGIDWSIRLGRYQIVDWDHDDVAGTVQVTCQGVLQVCLDDGFEVQPVPRSGETFSQVFTRLVSDGVGVNIDSALVDRAIPQSFQWDQDRLAVLYDIAAAWPARLRVDPYGTVQLLPPLPDVPVPAVTLTHGRNGTLISAPRGDTREGVRNKIIARSSATDDPSRAPVQAVAVASGGPLDPTTYNVVSEVYSSPLITTTAECLAAARTILATKSRPANARVVTMAPDPRLDIDDAVNLVQLDRGLLAGNTDVGWITAYNIPLTVGDGAMQITVGVV